MIFDGKWQVSIATPIGKQSVVFDISTQDGVIHGTAKQGEEIVEFIDPVIENERLVWLQVVTKPLSLRLKFEVTVEGDHMSGTAKTGMLPTSKVSGERVA